mmetsp:Transcript_43565/g.83138  ORF Transcript_43565/g.83138 Transcript_43565/m.83138 type:complete len:756 (+) Transcript_43565:107-2374(+)|eukprot:CAMPEP_0114247288 /NCGR_PEP_ID=MMETSP0058-20121206/12941_1 /TAXON_ID=36894 /ORGANISM="Pyramimonas parkeae, CCMP726" /LENGTH=755 /DNA_ID=CAMNT_0001360581 /DNA_START=153 /DNA_END=2420 /DNA_ORIENTATION=+
MAGGVHRLRAFLAALLPFVTVGDDALAKVPSQTLSIGAVGDIFAEYQLQMQAIREGSYASAWLTLVPTLKAFDVMFGNLEGVASSVVSTPHGCTPLQISNFETCKELAWTDRDDARAPFAYTDNFTAGPYTSGFTLNGSLVSAMEIYNYNPMLAKDLADSGFSVVSSANNHALDRGLLGLNATLDGLDTAGVAHAGTRRVPFQDDMAGLYTVVARKGWRTAWVACTQNTNPGLKRGLMTHHVLNCYEPETTQLVRELASDATIHATVVVVHWGGCGQCNTEAQILAGYDNLAPSGEARQRQPDCAQKHLARAMADAGATAVLGMHPHVLQGFERYRTQDERDALIAYSLGNFIWAAGFEETALSPTYHNQGTDSHQGMLYDRTSVLLNLQLNWNAEAARAEISCVSYVPLARNLTDLGFITDELTALNRSTYQIQVVEATQEGYPEEYEFIHRHFGPIKTIRQGGGCNDSSPFMVASEDSSNTEERDTNSEREDLYNDYEAPEQSGSDTSLDSDSASAGSVLPLFQCHPQAWEQLAVSEVEGALLPAWTYSPSDDEKHDIYVPHPQCMAMDKIGNHSKHHCQWLTFKPRYDCGEDPHQHHVRHLGLGIAWDDCLKMVQDDGKCGYWASGGGANGNCTCVVKGGHCKPRKRAPPLHGDAPRIFLRWCPYDEGTNGYVPGWPGMWPSLAAGGGYRFESWIRDNPMEAMALVIVAVFSGLMLLAFVSLDREEVAEEKAVLNRAQDCKAYETFTGEDHP